MERRAVRSRTAPLAAALCALASVACSDSGPAENALASRTPIVAGDPIAAATTDRLGLIAATNAATGARCSGVLLTSGWALTAQHCVQGAGKPTPGPDAMNVQAASGGPGVASDRIFAFGQHDVALVHLSAPLSSGSAANTITSLTPGGLLWRTLSCYGLGSGSDSPTDLAGTWRSADLTVALTTADAYGLAPNGKGQIPWSGDSGGPCFYSGQLAGLQSGAFWTCPAGSSGSSCGVAVGQSASPYLSSQASLSFVASWIDRLVHPAPLTAPLGANVSIFEGSSGSLELVAPIPGAPASAPSLAHYSRAGTDGASWQPSESFGVGLGSVRGVTVIEGSSLGLEVLASAGASAYLLEKPAGGGWSTATAIPGANAQRGTAGFVRSTFGFPGNFEVAVPNAASGIDYFYRSNGELGLPWRKAASFGQSLGQVDDVVLFESAQGSMEVAARVGARVYHLTRNVLFAWSAPVLVADGAVGRPGFFQSRLGPNGRYELVVPTSGARQRMLSTYEYDNAVAPPRWTGPVAVFADAGTSFDSVVAWESPLGPSPGNLRVFATAGTTLVEGWRENVDFPTTFPGTAGDQRYIGPFLVISGG